MDLSLQLAQKQVLSQKMQQSVEILQMNTLALSEYIRELAEENPLLEWDETEAPPTDYDDRLLQKLEWLAEADEQNRGMYQLERGDADETPQERVGKRERESLEEYLLFQINILNIAEERKNVLRFLAQSVERSGYLEQGALEETMQRYQLQEACAEELLGILQGLDPPGVGARSAKECLLIQLRGCGASPLAIQMTEKHLEDLAKNKLSHVAKALKVPLADVVKAFAEMLACEPKPGRGFQDGGAVEYIVPDVLVERHAEGLRVSLNTMTTPGLSISQSYMKMLKNDATQETKDYISTKLRQAEWVLQCISKRESTLAATADSIVAHQRAFFLHNDGQLKPLRMVDIAEQMEVHESTISRAVRDKYLQCDRGVFPLSFFFSKALAAEGEGAVSADSIQQKIRQMIAQEDKRKPLSDRELTEILNAEKIQISRRTVAKYREAMGIPGASGRKHYAE